MNRTLTIRSRTRGWPVDRASLRRRGLFLLQSLLNRDAFDIAIHLVRDPEMTRLNETFLRHAGSTDVITFDYSDAPRRARRSSNPPPLHGEIFICLDEARVQARRFRTTWKREVDRYFVHGLLHLAGYDDHSAAQRREMKREEDRLVRVLPRTAPVRMTKKS